MTRKLSMLGLATVAALALAVLLLSTAGAVEEETVGIYFTAGVGGGETAKIDGEQIGVNTLRVGENPPMTCETIKYNGEATSTGPVPTRVRISPQYEKCHVIHPLLGTRTVTVAMNGCTFEIEPQATISESEEERLVGQTDIACPSEKEIVITVYNSSNPEHPGATTLCTYKIKAQSGLTGTTLTNSEEDVLAHFNIKSIKGTGSGFCAGETVSYEGEATFRATNASSKFVSIQAENNKRFYFGVAKPVAKGEAGPGASGGAELKTEKVTVKCTTVEYKAEPGVQTTQELAFKPTYSNCTALAGNETHVEFQGCEYKMKLNKDVEFSGGKARTPTSFEIACPANKAITITVTKKAEKKPECIITLESLSGVSTVRFQNIFGKTTALENKSTLTHEVLGLHYEVKENPAVCGENELHKDGELLGDVVMKAFDAGGAEKGVTILGTKV